MAKKRKHNDLAIEPQSIYPPNTAEYFLSLLPPGYKERALTNLKYYPRRNLMCNSIQTALQSFYWNETPEGQVFWSAMFDYYGRTLPLLPLKEEYIL